MFGAVAAGRLVQTNLQQIYDYSDDTHFVFPLDEPYGINHLTVFLLGTIPFPEGYGAAVHFQWPGKDYIPLGVLTNSKPSAIFRLRSLLPPGAQPSASPPANLGIEIAPQAQIEELAARVGSGAVAGGESKGKEVAGRVEVGKVAEKVVKNLFNYLHSFGGGEVNLTPDTPIPLSVFEKWYSNFTRKIENDRGASFLDRED